MMTASELDSVLSELSGLRSLTEPIASLYLDTRWADEQQRERVRLYVQERVRAGFAQNVNSPAHEATSRTLRRISAHVQDVLDRTGEGGKQGLALFACESLRLWRTLEFQRPFRNELSLDAMPHLLQLARLRDDIEPAVVAIIDWRGVRLYEVALGGVVNEAAITGPLPRRHTEGRFHAGLVGRRHGGVRPGVGARYDRQLRNVRHLDELSARYRRMAVAELARIFDETPGCRVVLAGTSESTAAFERELPERVRQAVVARLPHPVERAADGRIPHDGIIAMAVRAVADAEHRAEEEIVERAVGQALRGGLAVLGPEDVTEAVNERRVHQLVIEEDFERSGWRCQRCEAVGVTRLPRQCPFCDGELAFVQWMGEEIINRVLADNGDVEIVPHTNKLHFYDGIAALLRQTSARGFRGAPVGSPPAGA